MRIEEHWVVDRIAEAGVVLEGPSGEREEVPVRAFSQPFEEGSVLRVPREEGRPPAWQRATLDQEETRARQDKAQERLERLRGRDPGGDLEL